MKILESKEVEGLAKSSSGIQRFLEENQKIVLIAAGSLIAIVLVILVYRYFASKSELEAENKASVAISRILPYLENADYERALNGDKTKQIRGEEVIGLVQIVNLYKGVPPANVAALYAGNCYLQIDQPQKAIEYFKIALESKSNIVLEGACAGLGVAYETLGNYSEAEKYYEMASSYALPVVVKDRYMFFQGLCLEKLGKKEKAEKLYRTIIGNNQSEFVGLAKAGLVRLGIIIE
ncbi:MAG: tetratricopeptide repeat protein [Ignavibacteria bacterium]|nr:tetratricopeptide repeat protein [Ignavibacteria bacterium]